MLATGETLIVWLELWIAKPGSLGVDVQIYVSVEAPTLQERVIESVKQIVPSSLALATAPSSSA